MILGLISVRSTEINKLSCVFAMVVVLPLAEFGRNDHREDAPHFKYSTNFCEIMIERVKVIDIEISPFLSIPKTHLRTRKNHFITFYT